MGIFNDENGVSEVYGYVILLGIAIAGIALVVLLGANSIQDSKTASQVSQNEQAFTVADSRLSKARFSTSIFQEAPFKVQDGVVSVDGDDSYLQIEVFDRNTGDPIYLLDTSGRAIYTDFTLAHQVPMSYKVDLGTIKATSKDGRVIGYQGGGVWTLYPDGGCTIVTPPDFDYNGVTLTLPITHLNGDGTTGYTDSTSLINAESEGSSVIIYPTTTYFGEDNGAGWYVSDGVNPAISMPSDDVISNLANPIPPGQTVKITIKSDFYKGWGSYLLERTGITPTYDDAQKTVVLDLSSGVPAQSGLVQNGYNTKAMDTTVDDPIIEFKMDLILRNSGNDYTITFGLPSDNKAAMPSPQFYLSATRTTGADNKDYAYIELKYVDSDTGLTEIFSSTIPFHRKSADELYLDLLDPSAMMTYTTGSSAQSLTWGDHDDQYDASDDVNLASASTHQKSLYDCIQHYMVLMAKAYDDKSDPNYGPVYVVIGKDKYEETSDFILRYRSSEDIKYLYITQGDLDITLGAKS